MKIKTVIARFLAPAIVVTLYYFLKYKAKVSPKAEVELSPLLKMGKGTTIASFVKVKASYGPLEIGERSGIASGCFLSSGEGGLIIGKNFICGPNVTIVARNYKYDQKDVHLDDLGRTSKGVKIGDNVWIGAGCTILDGSVIGDNTVIVANSLVNRRYKPGVILQGNPAKVVMTR